MFNRVSFVEKLLFTKHLAVMTGSGITVVESLRDLANQKKQTPFTKILTAVVADIENGMSLGSALKKYPAVFDGLYVNLIEMGEASGTLHEDIDELATSLAKERALRSKIQGATMYPLIVLALAFVIGSGITFFVLPQLVNVFSSLDVTLPLSTRILLFLGDMAKNYGHFIFFGCIALAVLLKISLRIPVIGRSWDRVSLYLPVIGPFLVNAELAALFRNTGLMLSHGLPLLETLAIQRDSTKNSVFQKYLADFIDTVDNGKPLSSCIETGKLKHLPQFAGKMIKVGEATGKLDETLLYLGNYFEDELDALAKNFPTKLEPILLIGIGLIVAFIALAIISPIYGITSGIHS